MIKQDSKSYVLGKLMRLRNRTINAICLTYRKMIRKYIQCFRPEVWNLAEEIQSYGDTFLIRCHINWMISLIEKNQKYTDMTLNLAILLNRRDIGLLEDILSTIKDISNRKSPYTEENYVRALLFYPRLVAYYKKEKYSPECRRVFY